jgi:ParB-like chromosome segregation protein Spo0J
MFEKLVPMKEKLWNAIEERGFDGEYGEDTTPEERRQRAAKEREEIPWNERLLWGIERRIAKFVRRRLAAVVKRSRKSRGEHISSFLRHAGFDMELLEQEERHPQAVATER